MISKVKNRQVHLLNYIPEYKSATQQAMPQAFQPGPKNNQKQYINLPGMLIFK